MPGTDNRFPKSMRLHLRKEIETLFSDGAVIHEQPVRCIYKIVEFQQSPIKLAVSVPKKIFRKAVTRNRIKRQMREAFRISCHRAAALFEATGSTLQLMFVFTGKEPPDYATLKAKIILILQRLADIHERNADKDHGGDDHFL